MIPATLAQDPPRNDHPFLGMSDQIVDENVSFDWRDVLAHFQTLHPVELALQVLHFGHVHRVGEPDGDLRSVGIAVECLDVETRVFDGQRIAAPAAAELDNRSCSLSFVELNELVPQRVEHVAVVQLEILQVVANIVASLGACYFLVELDDHELCRPACLVDQAD